MDVCFCLESTSMCEVRNHELADFGFSVFIVFKGRIKDVKFVFTNRAIHPQFKSATKWLQCFRPSRNWEPPFGLLLDVEDMLIKKLDPKWKLNYANAITLRFGFFSIKWGRGRGVFYYNIFLVCPRFELQKGQECYEVAFGFLFVNVPHTKF